MKQDYKNCKVECIKVKVKQKNENVYKQFCRTLNILVLIFKQNMH